MNHRGRSISENKIIDIRGYRGPLDKEILAFEKSISIDYAARGRAFASASRSQRITKSSTIKTNESSNKGDAMQAISESLLNAKLEAAEARTEARVARLEALVEGSIKNSENSVARIEQTTKEIKQEYKETKAEISKSKKDLILWGIGIAITSILAIWAINSSLISAVQSSYGIGMTTKDNIQAEVSAQTKGINEKLDKLIELQQAQPPKL